MKIFIGVNCTGIGKQNIFSTFVIKTLRPCRANQLLPTAPRAWNSFFHHSIYVFSGIKSISIQIFSQILINCVLKEWIVRSTYKLFPLHITVWLPPGNGRSTLCASPGQQYTPASSPGWWHPTVCRWWGSACSCTRWARAPAGCPSASWCCLLFPSPAELDTPPHGNGFVRHTRQKLAAIRQSQNRQTVTLFPHNTLAVSRLLFKKGPII